MKSKSLPSALFLLSVLSLALTACASAQTNKPLHFTGVLNDYSPANPNITGSPYEMHGQWALEIRESGTADFLADMTMSDYGTTNNVLDATKGGQSAHTHHIKLTNVTVIPNIIGCPAYPKPATTFGFQINGTVTFITGNGSNAPFETTPPSSTLQVCVSGGTEIELSNMTMVFGGPATNHFGTQPIHGVVRRSLW